MDCKDANGAGRTSNSCTQWCGILPQNTSPDVKCALTAISLADTLHPTIWRQSDAACGNVIFCNLMLAMPGPSETIAITAANTGCEHKIALIGVTGRVGSRLTTELLSRGHALTGIALHVPTDVRTCLTVLEADATKLDSLAPRLVGHDAVVSEPDLEWAFLTPSPDFASGDQLLSDAKGTSHISTEDFVIATVDELKQRAHSRQRFTVGY